LLELRPSQLLAGVFVGIITTGAIALSLPFATYNGISFVDALFTATSATCVTGLMVLDAGTTFTLFGQLVILALIQIGGLGIMTFSTFFMIILGRSLTMKESSIVFSTFDHGHKLSIRDLLKKVMYLAFSVELLGAAMLFFRWLPDYGAGRAFYYAIFHSISAFCNAGITLFPDSLLSFADDVVVNGVIGTLIVIGSLGFLTIVELQLFGDRKKRNERARLSLNCKLILIVTFSLIMLGAILTFAMERSNVLAGMHLHDQIMASFFQSISRTAGFVTVDFQGFTNGSLYLYILLMFVGAAPGSVGGGIKVTTFGILIALVISRLKARETVNMMKRTVPNEIVSRSLSIMFVSVQVIVIFTMILLYTESGGPDSPLHREMFMQIMFETVSAFGTVGLSAGATGHLSEFGKVAITLLMLIGRLGPLTITLAVGRRMSRGRFQYSEENVMVG
jgi:trk system potassium uptake protein TrkH